MLRAATGSPHQRLQSTRSKGLESVCRRSGLQSLLLARWDAVDVEQFEAEGLDLGEHAVQRGLVRDRPCQHGVLSAYLRLHGGERQAHRVAQVAAHINLVLPRLLLAARAGHVGTPSARNSGHEPGPVVAVSRMRFR